MFRADQTLILSYRIAFRLSTHSSPPVHLNVKPLLTGSMSLQSGRRDTILLLNASAYITIGKPQYCLHLLTFPYTFLLLLFW